MASVLGQTIKREFHSSRVSAVEFAESSDYCGKPLYPLQRVLLKLIFLEEMEGWEEDILTEWQNDYGEITISPGIRERRDYCRDKGFEHFSEIVFVGGRRSGKGHVTGLAGGYKLFKVQSLPDPGTHYGIDIDKQIYFTCLAASLDQAKKFQFADLYSTITRCKALTPFVSKAQEESISIKTLADEKNIRRMQELGMKPAKDFSKLKVQPLAANADTLRGSTSILLVYDEMAKMMPGESRSSASECYGAAEPSLAQFGPAALTFCNSSPHTRIGQFYEQYNLAMRPDGGSDPWYPMRFAINFPSWALYNQWWKDPQRRWNNAIMVSPDWPDILDIEVPESELDEISQSKRHHETMMEVSNPDTYKVERRAQWAEVLDSYLNPVTVDRAFSDVKPDGSPLKMTTGGEYYYDYKMHCDPSSTTAGFGFAIGHVEEFEDTTGFFPGGVARHVVFDVVKRWNPQDFPGGTINYIAVREELEHYLSLYRPSELSFDQFNSVSIQQELRMFIQKRGMGNIRIHEVTATAKLNWDRWESFKTALNLGLIHVPVDCIDPKSRFDHSDWVRQELKFLREYSAGQVKRVDKQENGPVTTKDVADCVAEVSFKFLSSYMGAIMEQGFNASISFGASGGYQIGGRQSGGPQTSKERGGAGGASHFNDWYGSAGHGRGAPSTWGIRR